MYNCPKTLVWCGNLLYTSIKAVFIAHNNNRELAKRGGFEVSNRWWEHCPSPVFCNDSMKLLWDFTIQA